MIGYRFVDDHRAEYRVTDLCRVGGVCRSGYYGWLNRGPSKREVADVELLVEIREIYQASRCTYGSPRVWQQLRNRGHNVGRNRVTRLMRINHLVGACAPRRRRNKKPAPCGDLLARDFTAVAPDQRWVTDITEFRCADTKVWLAGVLDLCDRSLVGWSVATHQNTELVVDALTMALARRQPETGLIHHSDHGTQYTSLTFTNRLNEAKLVASYGSVGDCYDNATMESFWATLKKNSATSTDPHNNTPTRNYEPSCSTTSKCSTTANATTPHSATAPPTKPTPTTKPHEHHKPSKQPVHKTGGGPHPA